MMTLSRLEFRGRHRKSLFSQAKSFGLPKKLGCPKDIRFTWHADESFFISDPLVTRMNPD
jgi:hypothetical protein